MFRGQDEIKQANKNYKYNKKKFVIKKRLEKNCGIGVRRAKCHYALFLVFVNITTI